MKSGVKGIIVTVCVGVGMLIFITMYVFIPFHLILVHILFLLNRHLLLYSNV